MNSRRELLPVIIAGVGALAVLTTLAFSWREIAVQYHVPRLRRDPAYVSAVVEQPEGTVVREALRRAITTPDGAETFCRAIVLESLGLCGRRPDEVRKGGIAYVAPDSQRVFISDLFRSGKQRRFDLDASQTARFAAFQGLFPEIKNATCGLEGMGDFLFRVSRIPLGRARQVPVGFLIRLQNVGQDSAEERLATP